MSHLTDAVFIILDILIVNANKKRYIIEFCGLKNVLFFSDIPPSMGGRYTGFGYTKEQPPRSQSQEMFDTALSSLANVISC